MVPKLIAITLVVVVGAVAAYDMKFLKDRYDEGASVDAPRATEDEQDNDEPEYGDTDEAGPGDAPAPPAAFADEQPQQIVMAQQNPAEPPSTGGLPAIFEMKWVSPFGDKPEEQTAETGGSPPVQADWGKLLQNRTVTVSAVLISRTGRRAVINRRIVSEGDKLAESGAVVSAISPGGVELELGGCPRFFAVGGADSGEASGAE